MFCLHHPVPIPAQFGSKRDPPTANSSLGRKGSLKDPSSPHHWGPQQPLPPPWTHLASAAKDSRWPQLTKLHKSPHHCIPFKQELSLCPLGPEIFPPSTYSPSPFLVSRHGHPCPWPLLAPRGIPLATGGKRDQEYVSNPHRHCEHLQYSLRCYQLKIESYNYRIFYVSPELIKKKKNL